MILIVDSGSTKTDWIALDKNGVELFSTQTLGLNPQMLSNEILNERIKNNFDIYKNRNIVEKLFFYGAGCGVESTQNRILKVFKSIFTKSEFDIKEDTYAAVYSAVDIGTPSIVNIIGTGSNCSYYDGENVIQKVDSLGYVLMDYASGNYYGKYLIRAYYFNKMPENLRKEFAKNYDLITCIKTNTLELDKNDLNKLILEFPDIKKKLLQVVNKQLLNPEINAAYGSAASQASLRIAPSTCDVGPVGPAASQPDLGRSVGGPRPCVKLQALRAIHRGPWRPPKK